MFGVNQTGSEDPGSNISHTSYRTVMNSGYPFYPIRHVGLMVRSFFRLTRANTSRYSDVNRLILRGRKTTKPGTPFPTSFSHSADYSMGCLASRGFAFTPNALQSRVPN